MSEIQMKVMKDGSILGRRRFGDGTIAMQRLQFSSSEGVAFSLSSQRVPQVIVYHDERKSILRLPHGWFRGGIVDDICPSITISSFEFNNYVLEYGRSDIQEEMDRSL